MSQWWINDAAIVTSGPEVSRIIPRQVAEMYELPHVPTDGRLLRRDQHPELWAAIGDMYGGADTDDMFAVPNLHEAEEV